MAVSVLLSIVLLTLAISLLLPKKYTAVTSLVVDMKSTSVDPVTGVPIPLVTASYIPTQIDIIGNDRVAEQVVAMTRMDQVPSLRADWQEQTDGKGGDAGFRRWLARLLQKQLDVRPSAMRESTIINISYVGSDPVFSAAIANAFAQAYININLELRVDPARNSKKWFEERTQGVRDALETAQRRLSAYEQENGVLAGDGRLDAEKTRLLELNSQLSAALGLRADSAARKVGRSESAEVSPEVINNPVVAGLTSELARREADRKQLLDRLGTNHPQILALNEQISELRQRRATEVRRVAESLDSTSSSSEKRIKEFREEIDRQQARVFELKKHQDQLVVFQHDVESAQRAYDLVIQRLAQTNLESQTQQANVAVLTPASPPLEHSSPKVILNVVIAVFLGTMLGVGAALLLELFDQRVRGSEDIMQMDAPLLGIIPGLKKSRGRRLRHRLVAA